MKFLQLILISLILPLFNYAQHIAVAVDRENILYAGLDNPLTITAENYPCNKLVVKTNNGNISGSEGSYNFSGGTIGRADITVYAKIGKSLKKLGVSSFRVKGIPAPIFKIGPYGEGNKYSVDHRIIAAQNYVRAEINCCGFDAKANIDSFYVEVLNYDSCRINTYFNITGELNEPIRYSFSRLQKNDIVIFKKIYAKGPDGNQWLLDPLFLLIQN